MTIRQFLMAIPLLFVAWISVLVAVGLLSDEAPASVVFFPSEKFTTNLPDGAAVLAKSRFTITLRSDEPQFAKSLYKRGARIVLPAGLAGCLPLSFILPKSSQ